MIVKTTMVCLWHWFCLAGDNLTIESDTQCTVLKNTTLKGREKYNSVFDFFSGLYMVG